MCSHPNFTVFSCYNTSIFFIFLQGVGGGQTVAEYIIALEERVRTGNLLADRAGALPPPVYLENEVEVIEQAHRNRNVEDAEDDTDRLISRLAGGGDEVVTLTLTLTLSTKIKLV